MSHNHDAERPSPPTTAQLYAELFTRQTNELATYHRALTQLKLENRALRTELAGRETGPVEGSGVEAE